MSSNKDASFLDAADGPLRLGAMGPEDLEIISALVQDAVFQLDDTQWDKAAGQFAILLNRMRWEADETLAPERTRAVLAIQHVTHIASSGIDLAQKQLPLVALSIAHSESSDGAELITLHLSGGGALRLSCRAVEVVLRDVTRPYLAPSGKRPFHPE